MNLLNVFVQHFTVQHSLRGVCIHAFVGWPPKAIVEVTEDHSVEEAHEEEGQPEVASCLFRCLLGVIEVQSGFGLADENELVTEKCFSQPGHAPVEHVEKAEWPAFACGGQNQRQRNWRHARADHLETRFSGYLPGALKSEEPEMRFVEDAHPAVVEATK